MGVRVGMEGSFCVYTLPEIFFPVVFPLRPRHSLVLEVQISLCSNTCLQNARVREES